MAASSASTVRAPILVAPAAFGGTLRAPEVAAALARGLEAGGWPVDPCPVADGGAGTLEHLYQAVVEGKASAVLAASIFHFGEISIPQAKQYLKEKGIAVY